MDTSKEELKRRIKEAGFTTPLTKSEQEKLEEIFEETKQSVLSGELFRKRNQKNTPH